MNRMKKYMAPIIKRKCAESYQKGFSDGRQRAAQNMMRALDNEIASYRRQIATLEEMVRMLREEKKG